MAQITTKDAIAKPLLRIKPVQEDYQRYLQALDMLKAKLNSEETEEHNKAYIKDFLLDAFYRGHNEINTCGDIDDAIYSGATASSSVDVIIEVKAPNNKSEFPSLQNLNCKGMQETVLYFMRQRHKQNNITLKHVIITNGYEWYIFDAKEYERYFYQDTHFRTAFIEYDRSQTLFTRTQDFYSDIAKPQIDKVKTNIKYIYYDIRALTTDAKLLINYKLLSPQHLLKQFIYTDSNSLDKGFYNELLHIIGLEEVKEDNKLVIKRKSETSRDENSLLEATLYQLETYTLKEEERFETALNLVITWVNRILFLKLLESQLISYHPHKSINDFQILSINKIKDYDELNELFFMVLAKPTAERNSRVKEKYNNVPYLNSSLFEMTKNEEKFFCIGQLKEGKMPLFKQTVLKTEQGKRMQMDLDTLEYMFRFMDAYDFGTEATDSMTKEDSRTLINASVLGLIFEKINGYKDGSFFTPGMITQYMCHETITRAVVQKFNEHKGWQCENINQLYDKIEDRQEANDIINSLSICDPAVGSGHFLVSALNEIIAIKSHLHILQDKEGKRLKEWDITVDNDELCICDGEGEFFHYNPKSADSQRVQETLFNEKRYLIEHCLFGVDLNPNSVNICRLRLWIELLKNAYYREDGQLETLPNIDINIKCGDSLCAKYAINCDITHALNTAHITIDEYRQKIDDYRNAQSKEDKHALEQVIQEIKHNISSDLRTNDPTYILLNKKKQDYYNKYVQTLIEVELSNADKKRKKKLEDEIAKYQQVIDDIQSNKIYEKALEWRFEFPEVLDADSRFVGFDIVIGNPPYVQLQSNQGALASIYESKGFKTFARTGDLYCLFYERGWNILRKNGLLCFITSNKWMRAGYGEKTREFFANDTNPQLLIDFAGVEIFENATVDTNILLFEKAKNANATICCATKKMEKNSVNNLSLFVQQNSSVNSFSGSDSWVILSPIEQSIKRKIESVGTPLSEWDINIYRGVLTGYNEAFIISTEKREQILAACKTEDERSRTAELIRPILRGRDIKRYSYDWAELWLIAFFPSRHYKIDDFPTLKEHLLSFGIERLEQTGKTHKVNGETIKARKKTNNEWFEVQDSISYWDDFNKPKIIWKRIGSILRFSYDESGVVGLDSTCFAIGKSLAYVCCVLNSRMGHYLLKDAPKTGTGDLLISVQAVDPIRIPPPPEHLEYLQELLNAQIKKCTDKNDKLIDDYVYSLYNLTQEEMAFVNEFVTEFE